MVFYVFEVYTFLLKVVLKLIENRVKKREKHKQTSKESRLENERRIMSELSLLIRSLIVDDSLQSRSRTNNNQRLRREKSSKVFFHTGCLPSSYSSTHDFFINFP